MNNTHMECTETKEFDLSNFEVDSSYFKAQIENYEEKYRTEFPNGWGEFFALYSKGATDKANLDYDEWAFLCDFFMQQSWVPPEDTLEMTDTKPEAISGFTVSGGSYCSMQIRTSEGLTGCSTTVGQCLALISLTSIPYLIESRNGCGFNGGSNLRSQQARGLMHSKATNEGIRVTIGR